MDPAHGSGSAEPSAAGRAWPLGPVPGPGSDSRWDGGGAQADGLDFSELSRVRHGDVPRHRPGGNADAVSRALAWAVGPTPVPLRAAGHPGGEPGPACRRDGDGRTVQTWRRRRALYV